MKDQIKKVFSSAELVYENKDYTSATILYFKAFFLLCDHFLLENQGLSPKDHTQRFQLLKKHYPEFYEFLDTTFSIYRETYTSEIEKEVCDTIRDHVTKIYQTVE